MKNILLISLLGSTIFACSGVRESESSSALPLHDIGQGLSFKADLRPADGKLTELRISRTSAGTYDAVLRVLTSGFGSPISESTEDLAQGLACFAAKDRARLITLSCSRDDRPVDGALKALTLTRDEQGSYRASLQTEYYNRLEGRPVFETKEIASGLELQEAY